MLGQNRVPKPIFALVVYFCHYIFNQAAAFLRNTSATKITKYSYVTAIHLIGCTAIPSMGINACFVWSRNLSLLHEGKERFTPRPCDLFFMLSLFVGVTA